ncbi:hypothetical protein [Kribbella steppae]|uniref:hypothetical protein n=1 Tax=Kribbella steppae TaxID=2512223 RepID=UPI0018EE6600|nr:hypothetical protein [Kribbella steppae]
MTLPALELALAMLVGVLASSVLEEYFYSSLAADEVAAVAGVVTAGCGRWSRWMA